MIAASVAFLPPAAHADAGIPMLPVGYPELLLYILPVILIEGIYLKLQLKTRLRRTMVATTIVNLIAMAMGYPLAWAIYQVLNRVFVFPPLQTSLYTHMSEIPLWISSRIFPAWNGLRGEIWPALAVWVTLLIPGFLLSGIVKAWLVDWYDLLGAKGRTRPAVWAANRYSYLFLTMTGCVLLYMIYSQM